MITSDKAKPASEDPSSDNVRVVVRSRPMSTQESSKGNADIVHVDQINNVVRLEQRNKVRDSPDKFFTFDAVFGPDSKQVRGQRIIAVIQRCVFVSRTAQCIRAEDLGGPEESLSSMIHDQSWGLNSVGM